MALHTASSRSTGRHRKRLTKLLFADTFDLCSSLPRAKRLVGQCRCEVLAVNRWTAVEQVVARTVRLAHRTVALRADGVLAWANPHSVRACDRRVGVPRCVLVRIREQ